MDLVIIVIINAKHALIRLTCCAQADYQYLPGQSGKL